MRNVTLLVVFILLSIVSFAKVKGVKHVVVIGLDGWGAYSVGKANMPTVKAMMQNGAYTLEARTVLPSSSGANWASMTMGASPELHGFTTWEGKVNLPPRETGTDGLFPSIFRLVRDNIPEAEIGYMFEWDGMGALCKKETVNRLIHIPEAKKNPTALGKEAVNYIKESKPTFLWIAYDQPDGVGHGVGHNTPEYYEKLTELDGYIAQIVEATKEAGMYENTVFIFTADHGGINKGHGGKTMEEMQIPIILSGKGVKQNYQLDKSIMIYDIASTIAWIFGMEQPQVWIGRPMVEAFGKSKK